MEELDNDHLYITNKVMLRMFLTEIQDSDCIKRKKNVCSHLSIQIIQTLACTKRITVSSHRHCGAF